MLKKTLTFLFITTLFILPHYKSYSITPSEYQLYRELNLEINKKIGKTYRNRYPNYFKSDRFLNISFEKVPYFARRAALLKTIQTLQREFQEKLIELRKVEAQPQKKPLNNANSKPKINEPNNFTSFAYKGIFLSGRLGFDYFYIDPGLLIPKNDNASIENKPYLYYFLNFGIDLNFLDLDFRFKNTFQGDNYADNYVNEQDTIEHTKDAQTRERYLNLIGSILPLTYGDLKYGLYLSGSFKLFQAEMDIKNTTTFTDKTQTITLDPSNQYVVNLFHATYAMGLCFEKDARYYKYKVAAGFQHTRTDAPYYIQQSGTIETISAQKNGLFILADQEFSTMRFTTQSQYGIARFERPNGEMIQYNALGVDGSDDFGTSYFYISSVQNTFEYKWSKNIHISGYLGYSGYSPILSQTAPWILLSMGTELYFYQHYIKQYQVPFLQSLIQLLYYFANKDDILYADIFVGGQIGFRLDF